MKAILMWLANFLFGKTLRDTARNSVSQTLEAVFEGLKIVGSDMTPEALAKALGEHAKTQQGIAEAGFRDAEGKDAKAQAKYKAAMQAAEAELATAKQLADADRTTATAARRLAEKTTNIVNVIKGN